MSDRVSALERAVAAFRAQLLAEDTAALTTIASSYAEVRARLLTRITELTETAETRDLTGGEMMRSDRAKQLLAQVEAEMTTLARKAGVTVFPVKRAAVEMGSQHAQEITALTAQDGQVVARVNSAWNRLNEPAAEAMVARMSDGSPLQGWLGQFGGDVGDRLSQALRTAAALGTNPRGVARMLQDQVDVAGNRLQTMARTEILGAYRSATLENYLANADILSGWRWLCAKQTRTCLCCLALDGRAFELTVTFQPSHVNCRCSSIPIIDGEEPPAIETGAEWFARQPASVQQEMMPATAYDDFKAGKLTLNDFVYLDKDEVWGDRYRQGSVAYARDAAKRRRAGSTTTIPTVQSAPKGAPKIAEISPGSIMPVAAQYRAATSIDDAVTLLKELGVESVDLKSIDLAAARNVYSAFAETVADGLPVPKSIRLMAASDRFAGSKTKPVAAYSAKEDALVLNPSKRIWADAAAKAKEQRSAGWWSTDDEFHVVNHEIGHQAHFKNVGKDAYESAARLKPMPLGEDGNPLPPNVVNRDVYAWQQKASQDVSRYGMVDRAEFVAEVYAGIRSGRTYSADVMRVYEAYGGPKVSVRRIREESA